MPAHMESRDTAYGSKDVLGSTVLRIANLEGFKKFAALNGYELKETSEGCYKLEHPFRVSESYIEQAKGGWLGYKIPKKLHR